MESKCTYLNCEGTISTFTEIISYNVSHFFRKFSEDENELIICRLLKDNPQENIVTIYNVKGNIIDMEMLDMSIPRKNIQHIENGLKKLHELYIVYIDLKDDNIGYSHIDKVFKLFDFNMAGIVNKSDDNKWFLPPCKGYILRKINDTVDINNLYKIDNYALEFYIKDLKKYINDN